MIINNLQSRLYKQSRTIQRHLHGCSLPERHTRYETIANYTGALTWLLCRAGIASCLATTGGEGHISLPASYFLTSCILILDSQFSFLPYSVFKLFTGFISAAFTLRNDTVAKATNNTKKNGITNRKGLISILKA